MTEYILKTDDRKEYLRAIKADDLYSTLNEFLDELRKVWKYGEEEISIEEAHKWSNKLYELMEENGICMDDYS